MTHTIPFFDGEPVTINPEDYANCFTNATSDPDGEAKRECQRCKDTIDWARDLVNKDNPQETAMFDVWGRAWIKRFLGFIGSHRNMLSSAIIGRAHNQTNREANAFDVLTRKYAELEKSRLGFEWRVNRMRERADPEYGDSLPALKCRLARLVKNNGDRGQIRRLEKRIAKDERTQAGEDYCHESVLINGAKCLLIGNHTELRLQVKFDGKPDKETRTLLKKAWFKWSPTKLVWQRKLTNNAIYATREIVKTLGDKQSYCSQSE